MCLYLVVLSLVEFGCVKSCSVVLGGVRLLGVVWWRSVVLGGVCCVI